MIWDWLVQRTGKYCSIRRIECPEFQTGIFGRMESARRSILNWVVPLILTGRFGIMEQPKSTRNEQASVRGNSRGALLSYMRTQ